MIDGYALIEINTKGEARAKEHTFLDIRLDGHVSFEDSEGADQLHQELPKELNDVLVMVFFKYTCHTSQGYEGEWDCEELFTVESFTVMKSNYKEFYREMVTEELNVGIRGFENIDAMPDDESTDFGSCTNKNYYKELLEDWETFYDEDFEPTKPKEPRMFSFPNIFDDRPSERVDLLPDIDIDLTENSREHVASYLRNKQGDRQ